MKFKLDENFGTRTQELFQSHGHNVQTVRSQGIQGCTDKSLYDICSAEKRCLVTLDLDFSDITRFPPSQIEGIAVIRVPRNPSLTLLEQLVKQFLKALSTIPIAKNLWIVEIGRIRIHQLDTEE
ncbi:MAG: DUF5615 family PIN-like protein [Nitrospirae bacterium]|nr:DUF5615 family PIN-like protein [Nitrospirota bacterium]